MAQAQNHPMYPEALPQIELHGARFYVDVLNGMIQWKDNPNVFVEFRKMMDYGNHYAFRFTKPDIPQLYGRELTIFQMRDLDPERMRQKYSLDPGAELPPADRDFELNEAVVERRLKGLLPRIMICGKEYIVDVRLQELRSFVPFPEPYLPKYIFLKDVLSSPSGHGLQFLYHPVRHEVLEADLKKGGLPKGAVVVEIPSVPQLDPVAVARELFGNERVLLKEFPLREKMEARIVAPEYSVFRSLVKTNNNALRKTVRKNEPKKKRGR